MQTIILSLNREKYGKIYEFIFIFLRFLYLETEIKTLKNYQYERQMQKYF